MRKPYFRISYFRANELGENKPGFAVIYTMDVEAEDTDAAVARVKRSDENFILWESCELPDIMRDRRPYKTYVERERYVVKKKPIPGRVANYNQGRKCTACHTELIKKHVRLCDNCRAFNEEESYKKALKKKKRLYHATAAMSKGFR